MPKNTKELFEEAINADDGQSLVYTRILVRLESELDKIKEEKQFYDKGYNKMPLALQIKTAQSNIFDAFNNKQKEQADNYEIMQDISNRILILENYISNLNVNDKTKVNLVIDLITSIECLLNIQISFPDSVERCLKNHILMRKNGRSR